MDVGLGLIVSSADVARECNVLILVLVDVGLGRRPSLISQIAPRVLILVLVDVGLGPRLLDL